MYINKMGMELEGAWQGTRGVPPFTDGALKRDGSVRFSQPRDRFLHYGELVSKPLTPGELKQWISNHAPTDVNETCGTHIHVSMVKNALYGCLLTPTFGKLLIGKLVAYNEKVIKPESIDLYHTFKHRLDGKNRFCMKGFKGLAQAQLTSREHDRYQQLNYCYRLRGTLEIRVFPATTNKRVLCDFVDILTDTINEWCDREHRAEKVRFRRQ